MAASRVDLEIGGDPATAANNRSPIPRESLASKRNSSETIANDVRRGRKVANNKNDGMGRVVVAEDRRGTSGKDETQGRNSMVHERPERRRLPLVQDEASKRWRTAELDKAKHSFNVEMKKPTDSIWQEAKFPTEGKRANVDLGTDNSTQIRKRSSTNSRKKPENSEMSISAKVIYKLVDSTKQRGSRENAGEKDPRELSPRRRPRSHENLIVDTTTGGGVEGLGLASSGAEAPRKLADSLIDRATESAIKAGEIVERRVTRSSTSQESPRVSEPRSSNDLTSVRQQARKNQSKCPNCGEPHSSYEKSSPRKYSGLLECQVQPYSEENTAKENRNGKEETKRETLVASLLYRSKSLPRLSVHDSGVACSGNEQSPAAGHAHNSKQLLADLKQLHTLKQHYYPEGGWGWVVLFVGTLVQMLSHGVHGSSGIFLQQVVGKFGHPVYSEPG
ncbi:hypothetical protein K0M31_003845 [Melipona bicolor]|uniref:Uncharacterized protein n=1 Tax=Melipona bicolor TaxID=60889 RepID=A0AA40FY39_9HYME|nr:hypothetical protein K0M31_003845 [Melipona bicolor]